MRILIVLMLFACGLSAQQETTIKHDSLSIDSAANGLKEIYFNTYWHKNGLGLQPIKPVDLKLLTRVIKTTIAPEGESGLYTTLTKKIRLGGRLLESPIISGRDLYGLTLDSLTNFDIRKFNGSNTFRFRVNNSPSLNYLYFKDAVNCTDFKFDNINPVFSLTNLINSKLAYLQYGFTAAKLYSELGVSDYGKLRIDSTGNEMSSVIKSRIVGPRIRFYNNQVDSLNAGARFGGVGATAPIKRGYVPTLTDSLTGEWRWDSIPNVSGGGGGGGSDNWGSQVVVSTSRFSGVGTIGSPLELAQQSATTGQVLSWSGSSWAPATIAANNWYTIDGTQTSNRLATGAGFSATWRGNSNITFDNFTGLFKIQTAIASSVQGTFNFQNNISSLIHNNTSTGVSYGFNAFSTNAGGILLQANRTSKNRQIGVDTSAVIVQSVITNANGSTFREDANNLPKGRFLQSNVIGIGTTPSNTQGKTAWSAYGFPTTAPTANQMMVAAPTGDTTMWINAATFDYSRRATINAIGFTEALPTVAAINFETYYIITADMAGWTLNGWEVSLGEQAHAAGTLVFDLVRVPAGGALGVGTNLGKQISLAANNRYGAFSGSLTQVVNPGDIILVRFVSNALVTGSPRGFSAKLNFVK